MGPLGAEAHDERKLMKLTTREIGRLGAMTVAGAAVAASFIYGPQANATPLGYINYLGSHGLAVYNVQASLAAGYRICDDLKTHNGQETVLRIYNTFDDVTSLEQASIMLFGAVQELCPWHDHRGETQAT